MKKLAAWLGLVLLQTVIATASGLITLQGTITSVTDAQVVIETPKNIYFLKRKSIHPKFDPQITRQSKVVTLTVAADGVQFVKSK